MIKLCHDSTTQYRTPKVYTLSKILIKVIRDAPILNPVADTGKRLFRVMYIDRYRLSSAFYLNLNK